MNPPDDDVLQLYREAATMEEQRPSPRVREAVLAHARTVADGALAQALSESVTSKPAANAPSWKMGLVASILLVPLIGVLFSRMQQDPVSDEAAMQAQSGAAHDAANAKAAAPTAQTTPAAVATVQPPAAALPLRKPEVQVSKAIAVPAAPATPASPSGTAEVPRTDVGASNTAIADSTSADTASRSELALAQSPSAKIADESRASAMAGVTAPRIVPEGVHPSIVMGMELQLLRAARDGDLQTVDMLVSRGARLNTRDPAGRTALIWATLGGHEPVVRRLLTLGADREVRDREGLTALQHARQQGLTGIAALLEATH